MLLQLRLHSIRSIKNYLLLLIVLLQHTSVMAQDQSRKAREDARAVKVAPQEQKKNDSGSTSSTQTESTSPAKSYIKKFWEYVDKMKDAATDMNILGTNTRAAGTAINNIKLKDKNYDVAPLESELQKWQQAYEVARNGGETQRGATNDLAVLFKLLYQVETNVAQQEIEIKLQEMAVYKSKTAEMVAMKVDPAEKFNAAIINNALPHVKADLLTIEKNVKLWETNMNMMVDEQPARAYYHMIQFEHAHWDALRKGPFAEKEQLEAGYAKVTDLVKRIGSLETVIAKGKARGEELLKNTKMPPALLQNPAMEKLFRQAFEDSGWKEIIIKVNLLDRDWKAVRNEITGVIEARTQRAAIAVKTKAGDFLLYNYLTIQQDYLGNAYSSQAQIIYHESAPILQENIK